ncbi:hypothetical protein NCCP2222_22830 [Sporosarcina sp. NCCP-2222]|nr:hypothetical protein NCCP2222_22830 [Sporosarcina sp. NCCP-2222]
MRNGGNRVRSGGNGVQVGGYVPRNGGNAIQLGGNTMAALFLYEPFVFPSEFAKCYHRVNGFYHRLT